MASTAKGTNKRHQFLAFFLTERSRNSMNGGKERLYRKRKKNDKLKEKGRVVDKKPLPVQAHVSTSIASVLAFAGRGL